MNSTLKNKPCPRCRFPLSKTHSEKVICKKCGYTSNKLQIVQQQDAFQANIRFSKRISMKRDRPIGQKLEQQNKNQNLLQKYLKKYQIVFKYLGVEFFRQNSHKFKQKSQILINSYKQKWFIYLTKMSEQGYIISGILTNFIQNQKQTQNKNIIKKQKEQSNQQQSNDQQQEQQKVQQIVQQQTEKIKKNTQKNQKDISLKLTRQAFNLCWKLIKNQKSTKRKNLNNNISQKFLTNLLQIQNSKDFKQFTFNSLIYCKERYLFLLSVQKSTNSKNIKNTTNYVRQQDLKIFCQQRNLKYQKRRLFSELTLFIYDLLLLYCQKNDQFSFKIFSRNQAQSYPFLLQLYKSLSSKNKLIEQTIKILQRMSEQKLVKIQQNQKKVPQISFKLICSFIYLTCILSSQCMTIIQIINNCLENLQKLYKQIKDSTSIQNKKLLKELLTENNITTKRVKKTSHQILKIIQSKITIKKYNFQNWCLYFGNKFVFSQRIINQISLLSETLMQGYLQNSQKNNLIDLKYIIHSVSTHPQRLIILQQPQIIIAFFGLDKDSYPYLKNIYQIWQEIKKKQKHIQINFKEQDKQRQKILEEIILKKKIKQLNQQKQDQLYLTNLLSNIRKNIQYLNVTDKIRNLGNKKANKLVQKIKFRNQLFAQKNRSLNLYYTNSISNSLINKQKQVQVIIKNKMNYQIEKQNRKQKINENDEFIPKNKSTQIIFKQNLIKQLDFLYEKQKQLQVQANSKNYSSNNNCDKNNISHQSSSIDLSSYIDHPSSHYQIIYHPTLNTLYQLGMNELLTFIQSFGLILNGQYTDCDEILEWLGYLEAVLVNF